MIFLYIFWVIVSIVVGFIGKNRKFGFWGYLFCSLFFTPLVGAMLVLASDVKQDAAKG
ncbi:MAG: hypothetical protein ACKVJG_20215 [Candidatus Latescibacterota bacterium]|jgi:uncharacterized membrane protein|tara:strand:- start:164 stop:337 length:174 start_codon:yes stop_codon:yes gene_type:complete